MLGRVAGVLALSLLTAETAAQNKTSWTRTGDSLGWWLDKTNWSNGIPTREMDADVQVGRGASIDKGHYAVAQNLQIGAATDGYVEVLPGTARERLWTVPPWRPESEQWVTLPARLLVGKRITIGEAASGTLATGGHVYCAQLWLGYGHHGEVLQSDGVVARDEARAPTDLGLGSNAGGEGVYRMTGGDLYANVFVGGEVFSLGQFYLEGGTVHAVSVYASFFGTGAYIQSGGVLTCDGLYVPWMFGTGTFVLQSGRVTVRGDVQVGPTRHRQGSGRLLIVGAPPAVQFDVHGKLILWSTEQEGRGQVQVLNGGVLKVATLDAAPPGLPNIGGHLGPINGTIRHVEEGKHTLVRLGDKAIIEPGDDMSPIGSIAIIGDLECVGSPRFDIDVRRTNQLDWDRIDVTRKATIGGPVRVTTLGNAPRAGDRFAFLSAGEIVGKFDRIEAPCLNGLFWTLEQNATSVTLVVTAGPCKADCDQNGCLEPADFECFYQRWQAQDPYADVDGDGFFTVNDLLAFQHAFAYGCTW